MRLWLPSWGRDGWLCDRRDLPLASFSAVASIARLTTLPLGSGADSLEVEEGGAAEETLIAGFPADAGGSACSA